MGGLQPILTRLPRLIEESVLSKSSGPESKRDDALQALDNAISVGEGSALNLDDFADEDLEVPPRPDPAITLSDLRAVLDRPILLPLGTEAVHLMKRITSVCVGLCTLCALRSIANFTRCIRIASNFDAR